MLILIIDYGMHAFWRYKGYAMVDFNMVEVYVACSLMEKMGDTRCMLSFFSITFLVGNESWFIYLFYHMHEAERMNMLFSRIFYSKLFHY